MQCEGQRCQAQQRQCMYCAHSSYQCDIQDHAAQCHTSRLQVVCSGLCSVILHMHMRFSLPLLIHTSILQPLQLLIAQICAHLCLYLNSQTAVFGTKQAFKMLGLKAPMPRL